MGKLRVEELKLTKELVNKMLSDALTRKYGAGTVKIRGFNSEELSNPPTKSAVFKIYGMNPEIENGVDLPPYVVFKVYRQMTERTSETTMTSPREEYLVEKDLLGLSEELKYVIDGKIMRVFPKIYSSQVSECDDHMCIFREFVHEPSVREIAQTKGRDLKWEDIKDSVQPIALQHVNSPWLKNITRFPEITSEGIGKAFGVYVEKLCAFAGRSLDLDLKNKIISVVTELAEKYICTPKLYIERPVHVVNNDLNIYPGHVTTKVILDAGSSSLGDFLSFMSDLVYISDPCFSPLGNLEQRANYIIEHYKDERKKIADKLDYIDDIAFEDLYKTFSKDLLFTSFMSISAVGSLRKAASYPNYTVAYLADWEKHAGRLGILGIPVLHIPSWLSKRMSSESITREKIEEEVTKYYNNMFDVLNLLEPQDKKIAQKLKILIAGAGIPNPFKISYKANSPNLPLEAIIEPSIEELKQVIN